MDAFKDVWVQAGFAGLLVVMLGWANWLQWKRGAARDEHLLDLSREVGAVAARSSASADKLAQALDGNTSALRELSLQLAGRGANR